MNKFYKTLTVVGFLVLVGVLFVARGAQATPLEQPAEASSYQALLGKPLNDQNVADFMAANHCSAMGRYQICGSTGIAFEVDQAQKVKTVLLFPGRSETFAAFHGELPYGLQWTDNMTIAGQKLNVASSTHYLQQAGLPGENGTPENIRLWVNYPQAGITIVYNTQSADSTQATIHAILVTK